MEQTYKIGEAAALLNLKTYVLRFWETEFPQIAPLRTEKGQRLYRVQDIELLERIRYLLHEQGLTIDGARKILDSHESEISIPTTPAVPLMPSPMEPAPKIASAGAPSSTDASATGTGGTVPEATDAREPAPWQTQNTPSQAHGTGAGLAPNRNSNASPETDNTFPHDSANPSQTNAHSQQTQPKGAALQALITDLEEVATILRSDAPQGSSIQ